MTPLPALLAVLCLLQACENHERVPPPPAAAKVVLPPAVAPPAPTEAVPELPVPDLPPLDKGVHLTIQIEQVKEGNAVVISGETNLPEGTHVYVEVAPPGDFAAIVLFPKQLSGNEIPPMEVSRGRYETKPIALTDGNYLATLRMFDPSVQPDAVRVLLGDEAKLTGPAVQRRDGSTSVETQSKEFILGGNPAEAKAAAIAGRNAIKAQLQGFLREYEEIERSSRSKARGLTPECMNHLRAAHAQIGSMARTLGSIPVPFPAVGMLRGLAHAGRMCADCNEGDVSFCDELRTNLAEAQRELNASVVK